jgi:hypothetical protein
MAFAPILKVPRPTRKPQSEPPPEKNPETSAVRVIAAAVSREEVVELDVAPDAEPKSVPPPLPRQASASPPAPAPAPAPTPAPALAPAPTPTPTARPRVVSVGTAMDMAFLRDLTRKDDAWETGSLPRITEDRLALKMTDEVRLRRAHLAKYVRGVVAACAAVCVIAILRVAITAATTPTIPHSTTAMTPTPR